MHTIPLKFSSFILHFIRQHWIGLLLIFIVSIITTTSSTTLIPLIISYIIDALNTISDKSNAFSILIIPLLIAGGIWSMLEAMCRVKGYLFGIVYPKFEANIRMKLFAFTLQNSTEYFMQKEAAAITYRVDDLPRSMRLIVDCSITVIIPTFLSLFFSLTFISEMHVTLAITYTTWLFSYVILMTYFSIRSSEKSSTQSAARAKVQNCISDSIRNQMSMRTCNGHKIEIERARNAQKDENKLYRHVIFYMENSKIALSLLSIGAVSFLMYYSIVLWQKEQISIGDVIFVLNSTINTLTALWYAADEITYIFNDIGITSRSLKIIQANSLQNTPQHAVLLPDLKIKDGFISFKDTFFHYDSSPNILYSYNVTIPAKQKVGLVGLSGSGKTTFINLLLQIYKIKNGQIIIDGQDISKISLSSLYHNVGVIQQEPILFNRTIRENISYTMPLASDAQIIAAAQIAHCHHFITKMPSGYNSNVGEGGNKLSKGQRQRIIIARLILKNAPILIMDEATSALDKITEHDIKDSISKLMRDKTVLVIAHTFSTLTKLDRIIVFDSGKIAEDGTHETLLEASGLYKRLWSVHNNC